LADKSFADAIESALSFAMAEDENIVVFGEDVPLLRRNLLVRFGPDRVRQAPISESAFLGAAVGAAMAGMRPVVEIMMVDFIAVAFDAVLNHAAKVEAFSGGRWKVPMVIRCACGGGYGDAGQHEQCLWGLLAGLPGLSVVVPSNPYDAAGLMLSALEEPSPVVYMEHKLLADYWLDYLGAGGRENLSFDVPPEGARGEVGEPPGRVPLGVAARVREGPDITIATLGVSVHRALEAARNLSRADVEAEVVDLRTVAPLDREAVLASAGKTGRLLVVDEDYLGFGLSGEIAALLAESGLSASYARVGNTGTIPYARYLEDEALPGVVAIEAAALSLL
jgi:acetoin:2,6-dichlorophenolindophenol oxidoreductase subunit beta